MGLTFDLLHTTLNHCFAFERVTCIYAGARGRLHGGLVILARCRACEMIGV